jgi:hypothetical protein
MRSSLFRSGGRAIGGEEDFIEDGMDMGPSTREAKLKRRWANLFDYGKGAITLLRKLLYALCRCEVRALEPDQVTFGERPRCPFLPVICSLIRFLRCN